MPPDVLLDRPGPDRRVLDPVDTTPAHEADPAMPEPLARRPRGARCGQVSIGSRTSGAAAGRPAPLPRGPPARRHAAARCRPFAARSASSRSRSSPSSGRSENDGRVPLLIPSTLFPSTTGPSYGSRLTADTCLTVTDRAHGRDCFGMSEHSVVVAVVAFPGFSAFFDGEAGDGERGERVGPPPSEGGVEDEPGEQRGGQPCAQEASPGRRLAVWGIRGRWRCGAWPRRGWA